MMRSPSVFNELLNNFKYVNRINIQLNLNKGESKGPQWFFAYGGFSQIRVSNL